MVRSIRLLLCVVCYPIAWLAIVALRGVPHRRFNEAYWQEALR